MIRAARIVRIIAARGLVTLASLAAGLAARILPKMEG